LQPGPLVTLARCRTVAKVDSMGLEVRTCTHSWRTAGQTGPGAGFPVERTVEQDLLMISDVQRLRHAFDEAELSGDTDALNTLLAEDFRSIGEQGYVLDKAGWVGKFAEFSYSSLESSDVEVCGYRHAAIVRCVQRSRSTWRGQEMALTVRVSQTWVELPEGWRLAGIQFSSLGGA
jgi:hypothetical protein